MSILRVRADIRIPIAHGAGMYCRLYMLVTERLLVLVLPRSMGVSSVAMMCRHHADSQTGLSRRLAGERVHSRRRVPGIYVRLPLPVSVSVSVPVPMSVSVSVSASLSVSMLRRLPQRARACRRTGDGSLPARLPGHRVRARARARPRPRPCIQGDRPPRHEELLQRVNGGAGKARPERGAEVGCDQARLQVVGDVVVGDALLVEELAELPVLLGDAAGGDLHLSRGLYAVVLA